VEDLIPDIIQSQVLSGSYLPSCYVETHTKDTFCIS